MDLEKLLTIVGDLEVSRRLLQQQVQELAAELEDLRSRENDASEPEAQK
jgi:hypothetical protein